MRRLCWLIMDFGIKSNVQPLFEWLDRNHAKECGEGAAVFWSTLTPDQLEKELTGLVDLGTRLYLISRDPKTDRIRGKFVVGGRKTPPWQGYAQDYRDTLDTERDEEP